MNPRSFSRGTSHIGYLTVPAARSHARRGGWGKNDGLPGPVVPAAARPAPPSSPGSRDLAGWTGPASQVSGRGMARRSSPVAPPQTPKPRPCHSAKRRQGVCTGQDWQIRLARSVCSRAGPAVPSGKNRSGSTSRQAASSRQSRRPPAPGDARRRLYTVLCIGSPAQPARAARAPRARQASQCRRSATGTALVTRTIIPVSMTVLATDVTLLATDLAIAAIPFSR
jgi:hypothetical protein